MTHSNTVTSRAQIAETVREQLAAELGVQSTEITDDDVLKDLPGADSLRLLRLVTRLERHWDTEFSDEEVFGATTFEDLVSLVVSNLAANAGPQR